MGLYHGQQSKSVLYTGVTSDLAKRVMQHKQKFYPNSFSANYNCTELVYSAFFPTIMEAIAEEKRIKGGSRAKKEALIASQSLAMTDGKNNE